jgi:hypothetical protein
MSVGIGRQNIIILFWNNEAAQFYFREYRNGTKDLYWILTGPSFAVQTRGLHRGARPKVSLRLNTRAQND